MVNARTKGANGEREAVQWLSGAVPGEWARNLSQTRDGGGDIIFAGLCIEVKRCETLTVDRWWRQVSLAADQHSAVPVLMYRRNRERWAFCLPAYLLVVGMTGRITLGEPEMKQWLAHWCR